MRAAPAPSMTVVVPAYNGVKWIGPCVQTLAAASRERIRLCLVDNGGNGDAVPADLPEFDYVVLRPPRPMGYSEVNNFALSKVGLDSEFVCFLNQDANSTPGWLDACQASLRDAPERGAVSPLVRSYDGSDWDQNFLACARASAEFARDFDAAGEFASWYEVPTVTAVAMVVHRRALVKSGPFDPIFRTSGGYEDFDLCRRIRLAGYRIGVCGKATVMHYTASSLTTDAARHHRVREGIRNRTLLAFREAGDHRLVHALRYVVGTLPRNLARGLMRRRGAHPPGLQLTAHGDLLADWKRIFSACHDQKEWADYLSSIGWPK